MSIWKIALGCILGMFILRAMDYLIASLMAFVLIVAGMLSVKFRKNRVITLHPITGE